MTGVVLWQRESLRGLSIEGLLSYRVSLKGSTQPRTRRR
ncbi:hypothetical protein RHCRD62_90106 [Rhodococcus sp. RD6.2]|nr:hypothetical protein RHCRD62_90106 [Rhodococcus sp. RD6.2]